MACRLCYREGHNRNNCPSYPGVKSTRRKAKCSYCFNSKGVVATDHNRSSCNVRKADLKIWIEENKIWTKHFKDKVLEIGLGIGSIVEWYGDPYYINKIDFEQISKDTIRGFMGVRLEHCGTQYESYYVTVIPEIIDNKNVNISSAVSRELLLRQFPKDWESGLYAIPENLKDTVRVSQKKRDA